MEAGNNGTTIANGIRYTECDWGDLIEGTKAQLQALGIGVGVAFPGEEGGPRVELKAHDPRGYPVRISNRGRDDDRYTAYLKFPNWPEKPDTYQWMPAGNGLKKRWHIWSDEYIGSAEDLATAGLVRLDQLPGQPGMRKVRVTIFPDGSLPSGPPHAYNRQGRLPGARWIERASVSTYRVCIVVAEEETARRRAADQVANAAWRQQVEALPRPSRLQPIKAREQNRERRVDATVEPRAGMPRAHVSHLRLVWSAPTS